MDFAQSDNDVKRIIKDWINTRCNNIHTALPGKIISYEPGKNRAQVQPSGKFKTQDNRDLDYPIIHNVPLIFPMTMDRQAGVTLPVKPGDGVMLIFSETQNEDFLNGKDNLDPRHHSLNDCYGIPGIYADAAPSENSHPDDVCIFHSGALLWLNGREFVGENVGGTNFRFSDGDLVVNGISVVHHTHPGCQGGSTGQPT